VRDREVIAIDISSKTEGRLIQRIRLDGSGLGMTLDKSGARLFVAQDNADQVAVIDTESNTVTARIDARAPDGLLAGGERGRKREKGRHGQDGDGGRHTGAGTFAVTLAPDGKTLYAVNAAANSIAVIPLEGRSAHHVRGLIPTAYEPHDITFSADGKWMYIINGKDITGPNPEQLTGYTGSSEALGGPEAALAARAANQYQFQLERSSLVSARVPGPEQLERLTKTVALNNFYSRGTEQGRKVMAFLRERIKHVIYVIKENRTFDQVLGDLGNGSNGDPSLVQFGDAITPSQHRLARQFVTLDNFMDPGDGSMDGWSWGLQGRVTNTESLTQQINYAAVDRGLSYESEGTNRNVPVQWATVAQRDAASGPSGSTNFSAATAGLPGGTANVLAGTADHAASDAPFGIEGGYIFSAVLEAGGTVRNYGCLENNIGSIGTKEAPIRDPFAAGEVQVAVLVPSLAPFTDVYYRYYDQRYPDLWRYNEWKREFDQFVQKGNLPNLSIVALGHDHMGSFGSALGGFDTPETQQADHDLAVGLLIQAVSESPYAADTLIILTEDDTQDGPDHVDSHRATTYVVGPYVRTGEVISTHYSQVNVLRTIEDILDTEHINLNTAYQEPMSDVFDIRASGRWSFTAVASTVLDATMLAQARAPHVKYAEGPVVKPKHDAKYWEKATARFDFSEMDRVPPREFNEVIWKGLMGDKPYPAPRRARTKH
jgi:YVTN family beta-propeller protein